MAHKPAPLWSEIHPRSYARPTVVKFRTADSRFSWGPKSRILFCVCGTDYGYLHTTGGDLRVWNSYSGAYKAAKKYVAF